LDQGVRLKLVLLHRCVEQLETLVAAGMCRGGRSRGTLTLAMNGNHARILLNREFAHLKQTSRRMISLGWNVSQVRRGPQILATGLPRAPKSGIVPVRLRTVLCEN